jgi:hypothetical protein
MTSVDAGPRLLSIQRFKSTRILIERADGQCGVGLSGDTREEHEQRQKDDDCHGTVARGAEHREIFIPPLCSLSLSALDTVAFPANGTSKGKRKKVKPKETSKISHRFVVACCLLLVALKNNIV